MIQPQTYLTVADNTGAKNILCIRVLGNNKQYGNIGDIIIGVVKDASPNMGVKRSDIVRAVIVRTKHTLRRKGMACLMIIGTLFQVGAQVARCTSSCTTLNRVLKAAKLGAPCSNVVLGREETADITRSSSCSSLISIK